MSNMIYRPSSVSSSGQHSPSPPLWDEERGAYRPSYEESNKKVGRYFSSKNFKSFLALFVFAIVTYSFLFWMEAGLGSVSLVEDLTHHNIHGKEFYTVVINTFERPDMLQDAVNHYSQCSKVKYIHIVWSEEEPPSEAVAAEYRARKDPEVWIQNLLLLPTPHSIYKQHPYQTKQYNTIQKLTFFIPSHCKFR